MSPALRLRRATRGLALGALAVALLAAPPARACSVCGCGDPLLVASDPAAIAGQLRLQLDGEYLRVDAGNEADPHLTDQLTQWTYRLNAVVRPLDRLALSATVPVVDKTIRVTGDSSPASSATALGDVELGGRVTLWRSVSLGLGRVQEVAVAAGSSLPTGPNGLRRGGERIDEHGQPGTGAWSPFAGLHYRHELGRWTAFASLAGRVHGENGHRYTYGAAALWSVHGQALIARRVALDLGLDGRHAAADRGAGEAVVNTGGTVIAAAPGVYVDVAGGAWLFVRAQVPVVKNLRGVQDQLPSVTTGLQLLVR
jgi:hypothetical protein